MLTTLWVPPEPTPRAGAHSGNCSGKAPEAKERRPAMSTKFKALVGSAIVGSMIAGGAIGIALFGTAASAQTGTTTTTTPAATSTAPAATAPGNFHSNEDATHE